MRATEYADCLQYIDDYWNKIIHNPSRMTVQGRLISHLQLQRNGESAQSLNVIDIPYPYLVPNDKKFNYIFYWDTFFMFKGILGTSHDWIMEEMVKNFSFLFSKYGLIPNFNAPVALGRSQPPFFTGMILDTYWVKSGRGEKQVRSRINKYLQNRLLRWLKNSMAVAKKEYSLVWIDEVNAYNHRVPGYLLSRFGDRDIGYAHSSELESGWDFTSRFYNRAHQYLPVDLNVYLYKYEIDFAHTATLLSDEQEYNFWQTKATERRAAINNLMWNDTSGFYFDYNWQQKKQSYFLSLAGFVPLWAGVATAEQADKILRKLPKFESEYGLTITAKESLAKPIDLSKLQEPYRPVVREIITPKQWDYPNIWSPLEYLTIIGLLRYGFTEDAVRIMKNSVRAHAALFRKYGTFFEKIIATTGEPGTNFHYENQTGFGWTNAAFFRYIQILDMLESGQQIYKQPQPAKPPFDLAIPH